MNCKHFRLEADPSILITLDRGHLRLLDQVEQTVKQEKGLFLGGNFRTGVAFGDCVQYGADIAKDIASYLSTKPST